MATVPQKPASNEFSFDFEEDLQKIQEERARLLDLSFEQRGRVYGHDRLSSASQHSRHGDNVDGGGSSSLLSSSSSSRLSVVCRHWLRNMCIKGEFCDFLHQYDYDRMPICPAWFRSGGFCEDNQQGQCPFKHGDGRLPLEAEKPTESSQGEEECLNYFLGFCPAGPRCKKQHTRRTLEEVPEAVPDWFLHMVIQNKTCLVEAGKGDKQFRAKLRKTEGRCQEMASLSASAEAAKSDPIEFENALLPHPGVPGLPYDYNMENYVVRPMLSASDPTSFIGYEVGPTPGHVSASSIVRCFGVKSISMQNVYISVQLGIWATGRQNTSKLDAAFAKTQHVILLFSANESGGFQGYARMASQSDPQLYPGIWGTFTNRLGANFRLQWIKQCKVEFERLTVLTSSVAAMKGGHTSVIVTNALNENKPIKKSRDGQEYPVGLAVILCRKLAAAPDEDLLVGTPFENQPRIDHASFFVLTPSEQHAKEIELGLRPKRQTTSSQNPTPTPVLAPPPPPPSS